MTLAISLLLARLLGPSSYGVYSLVIAIVTVLAVPAKFGLPMLLVREVAAGVATDRWGDVSGVWRWSVAWASAGSLLLVAVVLLAVNTLNLPAPGGQPAVLWLGLLLVPLMAVADISGATVRGFQRVLLGQLPELVIRPALFLALILAVLLAVEHPDAMLTAYDAIAAHVVAGCIAAGTGLLMVHLFQAAQMRAATPAYQPAIWAASVLPLGLITAMQVLNRHTDILMIGAFMQAADVGIYRVASQAVVVVSFGLQAMVMIAGPQFSRLYAQQKLLALQQIVRTVARLSVLMTLPVLLAIVFYRTELIVWLFGAEYASAATPLLVLTVGQTINAVAGPVAYLLNMTGNERVTMKAIFVGAAGNIVLNAMLIPLLGLVGAAVATSTTMVAWNVWLWLAARRILGIETSALGFRRPQTQPVGSE